MQHPQVLTQMGSNSEAVDFVTLLVQAQYGFLVDVIRSYDGQFAKPGQLELFADPLEGFPRQAAQVSQIAGIDTDADRSVALIVERQCHRAEVQQTAPK